MKNLSKKNRTNKKSKWVFAEFVQQHRSEFKRSHRGLICAKDYLTRTDALDNMIYVCDEHQNYTYDDLTTKPAPQECDYLGQFDHIDRAGIYRDKELIFDFAIDNYLEIDGKIYRIVPITEFEAEFPDWDYFLQEKVQKG